MPHDAVSRTGDGTFWESEAGYSRAVRVGDRIHVSGTTGHLADGDGGELGDTYVQTARAVGRGLAAVQRLGEGAVVVRSRVYLVPAADWQQAARAHRELLGDARPANTMLFVHALIGDGLLVEVELEAEVIGDAVQPARQQ